MYFEGINFRGSAFRKFLRWDTCTYRIYLIKRPPRLNAYNTWIHIFVFMQVEVKPYVLDDQVCDECHGSHCNGRYAPYFCGNIHCLRYYCEHCWATIHSAPGTQNHRCFIKENGDRPRANKLNAALPWNWKFAVKEKTSSEVDKCSLKDIILFISTLLCLSLVLLKLTQSPQVCCRSFASTYCVWIL